MSGWVSLFPINPIHSAPSPATWTVSPPKKLLKKEDPNIRVHDNSFLVCLFAALYQQGSVRDKALPFIMFITLLATGEIPSLTILYLADMRKSVYLGSLQYLIPKQYWVLRIFAFLLFLLFELFMVVVIVICAMLYAYVFLMIYQSTIFWTQELKYETQLLNEWYLLYFSY